MLFNILQAQCGSPRQSGPGPHVSSARAEMVSHKALKRDRQGPELRDADSVSEAKDLC